MYDKIKKHLTTACIFALALSILINAQCTLETAKMCNEVSAQVLELEKQVNDLLQTIEEYQQETVVKQVCEPIQEEPIKAETNYNYDYVLRVVAAECRGEPFNGIMAVAQTIHETAKVTGQTPEQVVKVKGQYAPPTKMENVNDNVKEACEKVFLLDEKVTEEPIRYFYSTMGGFYSRWHENSLEYVMTIGNHKFFKAKG